MYHTVVAARVRATFRRINEGDYQPVLDSLAPTFRYHFHGEHALGGTRTTLPAMRLWWERVFRLIPGGTFDVRDVLVRGWPWRTTVALHAVITAPLPDGGTYTNDIHQFLRMRWGRITEVSTMEDLQRLRRALDVVAAHGTEEAHAAPITDADADVDAGAGTGAGSGDR
ncbi:nuclear transport factor 2 family protein [Streptomyces triticirhizae]|uniref:Nuclear transport factor 2 family protein n=1 Tax=Streptomyces triticirhizae TaxID=2483353 RepID=A0A3M2LLC2_9ACTN|nr:nuclear transport factor 2 family protein [Streptomyces triticirhizae]RMI36875.1 nuclear transport factor 2 family protein [Streptomyces triticirhizae]